MVNPNSNYKDYLKHIDKCSASILNAKRDGLYSFTYKLPWYYLFNNNRHYTYMAIHNYFKYTMGVRVVITTYKGEIQSIEFSWN